jgi:hypothetical protein
LKLKAENIFQLDRHRILCGNDVDVPDTWWTQVWIKTKLPSKNEYTKQHYCEKKSNKFCNSKVKVKIASMDWISNKFYHLICFNLPNCLLYVHLASLTFKLFSVIVFIRLMWSICHWTKVITLSGFNYIKICLFSNLEVSQKIF